jgi:hypothetical protein
MCRRNVLYGGMLLAFGVGILVGRVIDSFWCTVLLAGAAFALGLHLLKQK